MTKADGRLEYNRWVGVMRRNCYNDPAHTTLSNQLILVEIGTFIFVLLQIATIKWHIFSK